jgi:hypothetical protein
MLWEMHNTYEYLRKVFGGKDRKGGKAGEICVMRGIVIGSAYSMLCGLGGTHWGEEKDIIIIIIIIIYLSTAIGLSPGGSTHLRTNNTQNNTNNN